MVNDFRKEALYYTEGEISSFDHTNPHFLNSFK